MSSTSQLRKMTEADIEFGMRLKTAAGWNQLPADWRRLLHLEPHGCFVLENDGVPVGTVTTTLYEKRLAWIGMVLVSPDARRHGYGTQLLKAAMKYCEDQQVEVIKLDATAVGKKLYDTLGYLDEYELKRVQGEGSRQTFHSVGAMRPADLWEVIQLDIGFFGVSRQRLLERLYEENPTLSFVAHKPDSSEIIGYLFARPGEKAFQIGPWISREPEAAEQLFRVSLNALSGRPLFLDILHQVNPNAEAMVTKYGFTTQREFVRMYYGKNHYPGTPAQVYAICGVEKG